MIVSSRPFSILLLTIVAVSGADFPAFASEPVPQRHFSATTPEEVEAWQQDARTLLFDLLKMSDLVAEREKSLEAVPFDAKELSSTDHDNYTLKEIEFNSTPTRRIKALVTLPKGDAQKLPAVVCIHGHGGSRQIVYDPRSLYRGFATKLAAEGYVTISTDVGQHEVYEEGRTLMGERLWDVMRCADYVATLKQVDAERLGCAGLSLGGEMAMWLGAMDPRMKVTVSSGFLTSVENMRNQHCPCWDFPGFTENFAFSDIYSLIAPRALQCQIGALERAPGGFPAYMSHHEMGEIQRAYAVFNRGHLAQLDIHGEGHVFETPSGCAFIDRHLKPQK
jgi:hypothetical protein